jgi:hypothetical protein
LGCSSRSMEITLTPVMVLTYSDPASPKGPRIVYSDTK